MLPVAACLSLEHLAVAMNTRVHAAVAGVFEMLEPDRLRLVSVLTTLPFIPISPFPDH